MVYLISCIYDIYHIHTYTSQGKAFFGRPALSDEEMEAIDSGGATAPTQRRSMLKYD
jgi:hypothetical protein